MIIAYIIMFYWTRKCRYFNQPAARVTLVLAPPIPEYRIHNIVTTVYLNLCITIRHYTQCNGTIRIMCVVAVLPCAYYALYTHDVLTSKTHTPTQCRNLRARRQWPVQPHSEPQGPVNQLADNQRSERGKKLRKSEIFTQNQF